MWTLIYVIFVFSVKAAVIFELDRKDVTIANALKRIHDGQFKQTTEYFPQDSFPPKQWENAKGAYKAEVFFNFHGKLPWSKLMRDAIVLPDDTAFFTAYIQHALIDAGLADPSVDVQDYHISLGIDSLLDKVDKNFDGIPVFSYWPEYQTAWNASLYEVRPGNLHYPIHWFMKSFNFIANLPLIPCSAKKFLKNLAVDLEAVTTTFKTPPDLDDTGVNFAAFGDILRLANDSFPESKKKVIGFLKSRNWNKFFELVKTHLYQPYSNDPDKNFIDPRSYYWLKDYLYEHDLPSNVSFITTWLQRNSDLHRMFKYQKMPVNVNDVDMIVGTAFTLGMFSLSYSEYDFFELDQEMVDLFKNHILLTCWILKNNLMEKLSLTVGMFYPSKYILHSLVGRLVRFSESVNVKEKWSNEKIELLNLIKNELTTAFRDYGVRSLWNWKTCDENYCYWDDFLGNGDFYSNGKAVKFHEDRLFSTVLNVNSLMDAFIETNSDGGISYRPETSETIKMVIDKVTNWLQNESDKFPKKSGFFSGSIRSTKATPFYFPHNEFRWVNGTNLYPCSQFPSPSNFTFAQRYEIVAGVRGFIPKEEYEKLLNEHVCFGQRFPEWVNRNDPNCEHCGFIMFQSELMTDAYLVSALIKSKKLNNF